jgi:hypothetical protein
MKQRFLATLLMMILFPILLFSEQICWVKWQNGTAGLNGEAEGIIELSDGSTLNVTYHGEINFIQLNNEGTFYWTPTSTYTSRYVQNSPDQSDIITLNGESRERNIITFSSTVINPIMAISSLGQETTPVKYEFNKKIKILNYGNGYWGDGCLEKEDQYILVGKEGNGIVRFKGDIDEISWTTSEYENWGGFTIGVPCSLSADNSSDNNSDDYNSGFEAGKQFCIDNPAACGISTGSSNCESSYATFNFFTNTLHIPYFKISDNATYWLDLILENTNPVGFVLNNFGLNQ